MTRRPGPTGAGGRLAAALGLAVGALVGSAAVPLPGVAAQPAEEATGQQGPAVELVEQPTWVRPGERFDVTVRVDGAPPGAMVDLVVHDVLASRDEFRQSLDEGELGDVVEEIDPQAAPAGSSTPTVGFAPDDPDIGLASRGVYPVEVRLLAAGGDELDTFVTYLSYLRGDLSSFTPLSVAVLVDVAADPALRPDGSTSLPAGTVDRVEERVDVMRQAPGVPLTLAARPETVEGLANGGPQETAALAGLSEVANRNPVFARPFVDVDIAALDRNQLLGEANAQAHGGANVIRSRLGAEPTGGMWLSGETLGDQGARALVGLQVGNVVVPPSAVEGGDGSDGGSVPETPVRLGDTGATGLVTDPGLAAHLTDGDGAAGAYRFVAELASMWLEAPSNPRAVVVHLPPDADLDADVVGVALAALGDPDAVRGVPVDQIFREVPPADGGEGAASVALAAHEVTDDLAPVAPQIRTARQQLAGVGALLDDPGQTAGLEQSLLLATGTDTPDGARAAYAERAATTVGSVAGAVNLPDEFRITLTSRSSTIPVRITNRADQELTVRLVLDSDQLEFPDGAVRTEVLPPDTTTRVDVPVRARTSGAFSLDVTVTSTDGSLVLDTSTFDVRSTAISGVGLALSIGAALFLAVWWAKHWRSARRSRRLVPADGAAPGGDHDPTGGAPGPRGHAAAGPPAGEDDDASYRPAHMAR